MTQLSWTNPLCRGPASLKSQSASWPAWRFTLSELEGSSQRSSMMCYIPAHLQWIASHCLQWGKALGNWTLGQVTGWLHCMSHCWPLRCIREEGRADASPHPPCTGCIRWWPGAMLLLQAWHSGSKVPIPVPWHCSWGILNSKMTAWMARGSYATWHTLITTLESY